MDGDSLDIFDSCIFWFSGRQVPRRRCIDTTPKLSSREHEHSVTALRLRVAHAKEHISDR